MEFNAIKEILLELINQTFEKEITDISVLENVDLINFLGMDSIQFIELVVEIETRFDILIDEALLNFKTFCNFNKIVKVIQISLSNHKQ